MLDILIIVVAVALILLSLLQGGKSDGISGAFTGTGGLNLFQNVKERGPEKVIAQVTLYLGVAFFVLIIIDKVL